MKLNAYITLPGTAAEAIELYKNVFQTEPDMVSRFSDTPADAGMTFSEAGANRIMHASFTIGNDQLMLSDAPENMDNAVVLGTQTNISVHPDSREETERIFKLLSQGGEVVMPLEDAFWGDYFGMVTDRFGIRWMINYGEENSSQNK